MIISFTGTRKGMTDQQKKALIEKLEILQEKERLVELHHGCAQGADREAHNIARVRNMAITGHPAFKSQLNAFSTDEFMEIHEPREPLIRNRELVYVCHLVIAAPASKEEELRSGTWATIRYARAAEVRILILWPDGTIQYE